MRHYLKNFAFSLLLMLSCQSANAKTPYRKARKDALESYRAKKYDLAAKQYRVALDLASNGWHDASCMAMIGRSLARMKRYDEALQWFELIESLPDINQNTRVRRFDYIGDLYYYQLKNYDEALENYQSCLEQTTDFRHWAVLQEKMARIYLTTKKRDKAMQYFKAATMCKDPNYHAAIRARRQLAALLLAEKKDDEVLTLLRDVDFKKYSKYERRTAAGYGGIAAFRKKDYKLALKFLEQIDQNNALKLLYSGRAYLALKQYDKARKALLKVRDNKSFKHQERGQAGLYIADSYRSEKKFKDALQAYKKALKVTSDTKLKKQLQLRIKAVNSQNETKK